MSSRKTNSVFSPKDLCEGFARVFGYSISLRPWKSWSGNRKYYVRLRYGKYVLKFFDGPVENTEGRAWGSMLKMLCDPDRYFNPHRFKGWRHFGKVSRPELALRIAAAET